MSNRTPVGPWDLRSLFMEYAPAGWVRDALCAQTDPDIFFPPKGGATAPAKLVCRRCPVLPQCREYAVNAPMMLDGVWGGLSERERRKIRSERGIRTDNRAGEDLCGTEAGAKRHYRAGEPPCNACLNAARRQKELRRA